MTKDTRGVSAGRRLAISLALAAGIFLLMVLTGQQYYFSLHPARFVPIHILAELFTILVAFSVFAVGWYTPSGEGEPRVHFLSAVFLAVGLLDVFHTLSLARVSEFVPQISANRTILFWLAARGIAALGLMLAALVPRERLKQVPGPLLYLGALLVAGVLTWVIAWREGWLPVMFVPGVGVTAAKAWAELVIVAALTAAAVRFYAESRRTGRAPATYFVQAIIFLAFGELAFTIYLNVFDIYNLLGHVYKVLGYFYIFEAAYVVNVRRPYEDLQRLVAERTAELERALDELKEVDRLKDDFVSGLSHDLRQPLVPIGGFVELLLAGRAGPLTDKQAEFLRHCRGAVRREADIIDELLDYARLRAGQLRLELERIDLRQVLQEAMRMLESLAMQRGLQVEAKLDGGPLLVMADRTKMLRVLNNLFSNAVEHNREHGLVRVEATHRGAQVVVSVADTGPGIAAEERQKVFERFYQAGGKHRGGLGIGLWTVREIVRLHGGQVELESEPGKGSRFTIILAWAGEHEAAPDTP